MGLISSNGTSQGLVHALRRSSGRSPAATDSQVSHCTNHERATTQHTRAEAAKGTMRSEPAENTCIFGTQTKRRDTNHVTERQIKRQSSRLLPAEGTRPNRHRTMKGCKAGSAGAGRGGGHSRVRRRSHTGARAHLVDPWPGGSQTMPR